MSRRFLTNHSSHSQHFFLFSLVICHFLLAQTGIHTGSFEFEGRSRSYMVFLPMNYQPNMPVVFNIHGYYRHAQDQMDYTKLNNFADSAGFVVVYPEAIWPGFNSGQVIPDGWGLPLIDLTVNDVGFISALIDTVDAHYDVNLARIYACGFSNGGIMAYRLAGQLSDRIAAIAAVSGQFCDITAEVSDPSREFPVLHIHGTEDENLPFMGYDSILLSVDSTLNYWIQNNGCQSNPDTINLPDLVQSDSSTVQKISYTNCSGTSQVLFYKILNGGHNWPGTNPPLTDDWAGHTNQDIDANEEIWNFFKNYENPVYIVKDAKKIPATYFLNQNYPNPFNPVTVISWQLAVSSHVDLSIHNILGQKVATLINKKQAAGSYKVEWDATGFTSGVYLYKLETSNGFSQTRKLVLLK